FPSENDAPFLLRKNKCLIYLKIKGLFMRQFKRSEQGRFKKLKDGWRKPRGINNKIGEGKKGIKPKIGWKKPEKEEIPNVSNLTKLEKLEKKEIIISSKVGKKKRLELEKFCKENKIKIINTKLWKPKKTAKLKEDKTAKLKKEEKK
ncbi:MAG: hypothetical protein KAU95_04110, partial [Candidatus Aenigmarchaeota archaeon]|nr:hypothetical protein [Candidatus Aenigmarchaeota archaeon]